MSAYNRNDPCSCGSGRKAKNCCMRPEVPKGRRPVVDFPALDGFPPRQLPLAEATSIAQRYRAGKDLKTAGELFRLVLESDPEFDEARFFYGALLHQVGQSNEGVELMKLAVARHPDNFAFQDNLARIHGERREYSEALAAFQRAHHLRPSSDSFYNMGLMYRSMDALEEAAQCYRQAIGLQPGPRSVNVHNNLGSVLQKQGKLKEAIEHFKVALQYSPLNAHIHSNCLYFLNFLPEPDLAAIFEEHEKFGAVHEQALVHRQAGPARATTTLESKRAVAGPESRLAVKRPLRIGYVSPDFRQHSVAHFIEPVLAAHDRSTFELFCYYAHSSVDDTTRRLQGLVPNWRSIDGKSDDEAADMVRHDRIDLLVDLAGHAGLNRLPVFARKPAPVQATWLGYPNTTGLSSMDYRITDAFADPPGMTEAFHTETLVRLPDCFSCFQPPAQCPDVGALPASKSGHIAFGSFNMVSKMTPEVLATWSRILQRVPTATLTLKYHYLDSDPMKSMIHSIFESHGVEPRRVRILGSDKSQPVHLEHYNSIDIGLDPFPYNGTTTTCDALWMGVPVVTLAGRSHVSRVGVSQMSNLGMPEMIARDLDDYVEIAVRLAGDLPRLESLRTSLRERLRKSPLMDFTRFTRNLEQAYQTMWKSHLDAEAT